MATCNKPYGSPVPDYHGKCAQGDQHEPDDRDCPSCFGLRKVVPNSIYMRSRTSWHAVQTLTVLPQLPPGTVPVRCEDSPEKPENRKIPVDLYGRWAEIKDKAPQDANEQLILAGLTPFHERMVNRKTPIDRYCNIKLRDFENISYIGGGSFGTIFSATYEENNKTYAIKAQNRPRVVDEEHMKDITKMMNYEKDLMKAVRHPFLCNVLDTFTDQFALYMVMELMVGDLRILIEKVFVVDKKFLTKRLQKLYAAQIILAVEYLHGMHILHRDLKPENVFIDDKGNCRVADYGLAYNLSQEEKPWGCCGTIAYMPPEQAADAKVYDEMADWFAIGVIMYEMATGKHPYHERMQDRNQARGISSGVRFNESDVRWGLGGIKYSIHMGNVLSDCVGNLTRRTYANRLCTGSRGARDLKHHQWFHELDWQAVFYRADYYYTESIPDALASIKSYKWTILYNDEDYQKKKRYFEDDFLGIRMHQSKLACAELEEYAFDAFLTW